MRIIVNENKDYRYRAHFEKRRGPNGWYDTIERAIGVLLLAQMYQIVNGQPFETITIEYRLFNGVVFEIDAYGHWNCIKNLEGAA